MAVLCVPGYETEVHLFMSDPLVKENRIGTGLRGLWGV